MTESRITVTRDAGLGHLRINSDQIEEVLWAVTPYIDPSHLPDRALSIRDLPIRARRGGVTTIPAGELTGKILLRIRTQDQLVAFLQRMRYLQGRIEPVTDRLEAADRLTPPEELPSSHLRQPRVPRRGELAVGRQGIPDFALRHMQLLAAEAYREFRDMNLHLAREMAVYYPRSFHLHSSGELQRYAQAVWAQHLQRVQAGSWRRGVLGRTPEWWAAYEPLLVAPEAVTPSREFRPYPRAGARGRLTTPAVDRWV